MCFMFVSCLYYVAIPGLAAWPGLLKRRFQNEIMVWPNYKIPATISWHHETYVNICTSHKFLAILLLYCRQRNEQHYMMLNWHLAKSGMLQKIIQTKVKQLHALDYFKTKLREKWHIIQLL